MTSGEGGVQETHFVMDSKFFSCVAFRTMESPAGTIKHMIYLQYLELMLNVHLTLTSLC